MGIYVVGMHRSGTSALSHLASLLVGYRGQREPDPSNVAGHWEHPHFRHELNRLLWSLGSDWASPPSRELLWSDRKIAPHKPALMHIIEQLGPGAWVLKDPRLCLMLDAILELPQETPAVLSIYRNPIDVARSIAVREGYPFEFGLALWEHYVRMQLRQTGSTGPNALWVDYHDLVFQPRQTTLRIVGWLSDMGLSTQRPSIEQAVKSLNAKLNHADEEGKTQALNALSPSQQHLLTLLQGLTDAPQSRVAEIPPMTPWAWAMLELRRPFATLESDNRVLRRRMRRVWPLFRTWDSIKSLWGLPIPRDPFRTHGR